MTRYGNVGAVVGQGKLGGAVVNQAVSDEGVTVYFSPGGAFQVKYGDVAMAPLKWLDDINVAEQLEQSRDINKGINLVMK